MRILLKDLQPSTHYLAQLRSVDEEGKVSDWSRLFDLVTTNETTPPMPPTNLGGTMNEGNLSLSWTAPTLSADGTALEDLKDYVVTIRPNPVDPEWRDVVFAVEGTRAEFTKEANVAAFGRYRAGLTVEVRARDVLDNRSDPAVKDFVKPRPLPVTGLTWVAVGNAFTGSWTPPSQNVDLTPFSDPAGYKITLVYAATNRKDYFVEGTRFDFSYEQNKAAFGGVANTAKTPITIEVRARDSVGQLSDPASLEAGNTPPAKVTGVNAAQVTDGIRVTWTGNPEDDIVAYEIWSAGTPTGAGSLFGRVSAGDREYIHQTVAYNQDHYLYVTAVDDFGSRSVDSDRSGPVRPKSPFTVDTTPPAATTLTTATPARATTEPAAVAVSWTAVADSDLAGYHIRFSKNTATRNWLYHDVIDKAATTTTIEGLASNTVYVFQIRAYDTMINPSAWSAEVLGTSSTSILKEIVSEIQIVPGGVLRSSNFNETNQTGWRLMDSGLDILSGRVNARVVSAGTLISSQTVTHDGTAQPAWSLNLAGNASLNDVQVRGKIVVGAGTGSANVNIASANYGGTGHQWAIRGDGLVDIRTGGPTASNVTINSTGIRGKDAGGNERFVLNTSGQFLLATTNGGVRFDDNGIYGYSGATNTFYIDRNGAAFFEGTVRAGGGHIGNWNISTNILYAGNLNLRADLGMIYGGDGGARVAMRSGYGFWAGNNEHHLAPFRVNTDGYLYSIYGHIGGWTINSNSLSGSGTISGGTVSGASIIGGSLSTSNGANRVVIAPNDGIDINFYSSYSSSPGYIDTRGRLVGSSLNKDTYLSLVAPQNSAFVSRPSISMRSLEGSGNYIYYNCPSGSHQFRDSVTFDNRPFINGVGAVENQGHTHNYVSPNSNPTFGYVYAAAYVRSDGSNNYVRNVSRTGLEIGTIGVESRFFSVGNVASGQTKTFVINHPSAAKSATHYLVHNVVEGPTADVYYRGRGQLKPEGGYVLEDNAERVARVTIKLPDYFEDIAALEGRTVQITPIAGACKGDPASTCNNFLAPSMAASEVVNGEFKVYEMAGYSHPCAQFYWEVKAVRKDIKQPDVEPLKKDYIKMGDGPYTYLMSKLPYGTIDIDRKER